MMIQSDLLDDSGQGVAVGNFYINNLCMTFTIILRKLSYLISSHDEELTSSLSEFSQQDQLLSLLTFLIYFQFKFVQPHLLTTGSHYTFPYQIKKASNTRNVFPVQLLKQHNQVTFRLLLDKLNRLSSINNLPSCLQEKGAVVLLGKVS